MAEFLGTPTSPTTSQNEAITYVQISDTLMMDGAADARWVDDYYTASYEHMPGYRKPEHYMEIPLWIPVISGMVGRRRNEQVHIVTNTEESARQLAEIGGTLLFSTIESNAPHTHRLVEALPDKRIIMGGHVDPKAFANYKNVQFLSNPAELPKYLPGLDPKATPDNHLFEGQETIPRLTLSTGCLFACEFCMVPRQITTPSQEHIWKQVESFKPLGFELVYLDDKTFGQAPNWRLIDQISEEIRKYNPAFKGFIIQTTANVAAGDGRKQDGHLDAFKELGVQYTEIGVESVNPETFRAMVKPYHLKHLERVMSRARDIGMPIIPNFIFGHPLDNGRYDNFIAWTQEHRDIIPVVNVNFLSVLYGAVQLRKQRQLPDGQSTTDFDQNAYRKSWLTHESTIGMLQAVRAVYHITSGGDFHPDTYADELRRMSVKEIVTNALKRVRARGPEAAPMLDWQAPERPSWKEQISAAM